MLAESLEQLYDDQFIETCAPWVGAVHRRPRSATGRCTASCPQVASPRAEVANTIRYRRRKGTASVLEQLARDVTGWPARAVEFFELLATTQYMNHVRRARRRDRRPARRRPARARRARSRRAPSTRSRTPPRCAASPRAVGPLQHPERRHLPLARAGAAARPRRRSSTPTAPGRRFRFDPLGTDKPLFNARRTEQEITHLAEPLDVPLPLRRRFAKAHLGAYGAGLSLLLEIETATVQGGRAGGAGADAMPA